MVLFSLSYDFILKKLRHFFLYWHIYVNVLNNSKTKFLSVVHGPAAWTLPGNLLELNHLGPAPHLINQKPGGFTQIMCFTKASRWFGFTPDLTGAKEYVANSSKVYCFIYRVFFLFLLLYNSSFPFSIDCLSSVLWIHYTTHLPLLFNLCKLPAIYFHKTCNSCLLLVFIYIAP